MNSFAPGKTKLGFIGLGLMGQRIAQRLLAHGYQMIITTKTELEWNNSSRVAPLPQQTLRKSQRTRT
jgi:3-hydroxyisobutyrate dehydrogenase-like beta-hydroxyacid dehydrogenase